MMVEKLKLMFVQSDGSVSMWTVPACCLIKTVSPRLNWGEGTVSTCLLEMRHMLCIYSGF
jgi:hypothetical protein